MDRQKDGWTDRQTDKPQTIGCHFVSYLGYHDDSTLNAGLVALWFSRVISHVDDFNNRNQVLTSKLLKQGFPYLKFLKAFSKFYYRHSELIVNYNICLKTFLRILWRFSL